VAGDRARAIASYEKALEIDPHNENALTLLNELRQADDDHRRMSG
jgi:hypothetical protein